MSGRSVTDRASGAKQEQTAGRRAAGPGSDQFAGVPLMRVYRAVGNQAMIMLRRSRSFPAPASAPLARLKISPWPRGVQRQPQPDPNTICYDSTPPHPSPSAAQPELHPTYAQWLASFRGLATFQSNDTAPGSAAANQFQVLGREGARYGAAATAATEPAPVRGTPRSGEEFIDHPTNAWVQNCLPPNLRATAYQLPSDCADMAVILRHVWLAAHQRTETYNGWTVGDAAGRANQSRAATLIEDVYSGNVRAMVNAYSDSSGSPLTSFTDLQQLLHPGDVLVWEHRTVTRNSSGVATSSRRSGGHTQTIVSVDRQGQAVSAINVVQGNQPIFSDAAVDIMTSRGVANPDPESAEGRRLRALPGRRIEADTAISIENIEHPLSGNDIWGSIDDTNTAGDATEFTVLVAAGPPQAAARPSAGRGGRRIIDWLRSIGSASRTELDGVLEAMLQEARSLEERGTAVALTDAAGLGRAFGARMAHLHRHGRGEVEPLAEKLRNYVTVIRALRDDSVQQSVGTVMDEFERALVEAALPNSTTEERRLFSEHTSVGDFLLPFAGQIAAFGTALRGARNLGAARTIAEQHGADLWQAATRLSQATSGGSTDDRPLYWTRLRMIEELRQVNVSFRFADADRRQLVELFEQASRGIRSAAFPTTTASSGEKRIVISGFDPFSLDTTIEHSNPSGAAVLALDGQTISSNGISGRVEGVIFPVRFRDFDQGIVENFFSPFLSPSPSVNMIMTISQGSDRYDVERWAGRQRTMVHDDNEGAPNLATQIQPPAGSAPGGPLLETGLPHGAMTPVPNTFLNERRPGAGPEEGSGGDYLSNEIFYRARLLQINTLGAQSTLPMGHLHVPEITDRQAVIAGVRQILEAALPVI